MDIRNVEMSKYRNVEIRDSKFEVRNAEIRDSKSITINQKAPLANMRAGLFHI